MELSKFIDNRVQEIRLEILPQEGKQINNQYVVATAEMAAAHMVLTSWQSTLKFLMLPKVLFHFLLMKLHIIEEPGDQVMINAIKAQQDMQQMAQAVAQKMKKEQAEAAKALLSSEVPAPKGDAATAPPDSL